MRILSLTDVLALGAGETIPSIRGTLTGVFATNRGTNAHGDWSIQNCLLKDASGVELKIKVCDRETEIPTNWKGRQVVLSCNEGPKGLTGLKAADDEYRGKVSRIVKATGSAHVELVDGQTPAPQAAAPAPSAPPQAPAAPDPVQTAPAAPAPQNGNGRAGVEEMATRRCRDYWHVLTAVKVMADAWDAKHPERKLSPEHFQAATSTVYIQLQRDGIINGH